VELEFETIESEQCCSGTSVKIVFQQYRPKAEVNLPLGRRVFGHAKRDDHSATMCYMIAETEERYVLHLLERTQHNVSKAARLAGIDRNYLYRMMKKHGIARKE